MIKRTGFTKIDMIVTLGCLAFIFANAQIISAGGRGKAKKDVCLANLRLLTAGWQVYAEDNAGKIVNGAPTSGTLCPDCPENCNAKATEYTGHGDTELPWIGPSWNQNQWLFGPASVCCQKCAISTGAMWKYTKDYDTYRCPIGIKGQMVTYSIIDSMNGFYLYRGPGPNPVEFLIKNTAQIIKPATRFIFVEEQQITPDSFGVYYSAERWFDLPAVRHGDGTNVSFADGHSVYWKWKAQETIDIAKGGIYGVQPVTSACKQDLYKLQIACWTKLGYVPSVQPDPNW